jgi:tripartite-type tricarboxylate transporter receptor subunit TctC
VTSARRAPILPNVPTIAEVVPGYEASGYQGIGAPAGTPVGIVERPNKELNRCLADPKLAARITDLGGEPFPSSPAEFRSFVVAFTEKWGQLIRAAEIKAE